MDFRARLKNKKSIWSIKNVFGMLIVFSIFGMIYYMESIPSWLGLQKFYRYEINQSAYNFRVAYPPKIKHFSDLKGNYVYLFFGFTQCTTVCPKVMGTLHYLSKSLDRRDLKFVFASIDPVRDTKESLEKYARAYGSNFLSLQLYEGDIKKVLNEYKSYIYEADTEKLKSQKNYQIQHAGFLYFIDKQGIIKYIYSDPELDGKDLREDFQELLEI